MKTTSDFSPTIRSYCDAEVVTLAQLAFVGGISRTQAHRQYHGIQPQDETLARWAESLSLPPAFRLACGAELERRRAERDARIKPYRNPVEDMNLDFNHDGKVDRRDLDIVWHKKSRTADDRRYHADSALSDGQLTPDEIAEQQRYSFEEETFSRAGSQLLQRLAHR